MSRKSFLSGIGIALALVGLVVGSLVLLIRNEPSAYGRVAMQPGDEREMNSKAFYGSFLKLMNDMQCEDGIPEIDWNAEFTEQQINSFFDEDFIRSGINEKLLADGISQPRVALEPDKVRLMFRYGSGKWSTIITIDLHVWLAGKEPNVVAMELQSFRAGSLPISAQSLLERISDALRRAPNNIEVSWYRLNGNPVAVLRFQSDPQSSSVQLKRLELQQGRVLLHGTSSDGSGMGAMLSPRWRRVIDKPDLSQALARK